MAKNHPLPAHVDWLPRYRIERMLTYPERHNAGTRTRTDHYDATKCGYNHCEH
jgi:hypothetical protein